MDSTGDQMWGRVRLACADDARDAVDVATLCPNRVCWLRGLGDDPHWRRAGVKHDRPRARVAHGALLYTVLLPLCSSCMHAWAASDTDADTLKLPHHSLAFPTPNQARTPHPRIMYNARDLHASRAAAAALSSRLDPWLSVLRPPCVCWVLTA